MYNIIYVINFILRIQQFGLVIISWLKINVCKSFYYAFIMLLLCFFKIKKLLNKNNYSDELTQRMQANFKNMIYKSKKQISCHSCSLSSAADSLQNTYEQE